VPEYVGFVNDRAGVLDETRRAQLEAFLQQVKERTGAEFAVLTVNTCAPEPPEAYKVRVFDAWKIGKKGEDNGLLLLLAMQEHRIVFETGYGLEGTLPDGWEAGMLRDLAVPRLRAGQTDDAVTAAVLAAAQRIAHEKGVTLTWDGRELRYDDTPVRAKLPPRWILVMLLFIVLSIVSRLMGAARYGRGVWFGGGGPWIGGGFGGGGGGFGGGGGGFGGFGGGGSGGGGGGASW